MWSVTLDIFADASSKGVCAAVCDVVDQLKGKSQGLLTSKSRLSKKTFTIPRLELIAAHLATNLLSNAKIMWKSSLFATECKKSSNRASSSGLTFRQVENSADTGSRGFQGIDIKNSWANGPSWLPDREN